VWNYGTNGNFMGTINLSEKLTVGPNGNGHTGSFTSDLTRWGCWSQQALEDFTATLPQQVTLKLRGYGVYAPSGARAPWENCFRYIYAIRTTI
jgi:hypothetical protein